MKDIKFAVTFPKYHPRAGEPTHFVEKIWEAVPFAGGVLDERLQEFANNFQQQDWTPKRTTIRAGHRWKEGDFFVPKIWTGIPYRSKPIAICEPLEVLETEDYEVNTTTGFHYMDKIDMSLSELKIISIDDGFDELEDFECWFSLKKGQTFDGQRIRFA